MLAGFLGWLLDAFDFFLVTFSLTAMARDFHKTDAQIALVITLTLAFRPVGALIFGLMADRYGRRIPLMVNMVMFTAAEICTGLAPDYVVLLFVRAIFGIVMGGQWGVGTSLVMEKSPTGKRGMLSGLLQEGYAAGNVLAAGSYLVFYSRFGWRPLFFLGSLPALLVAAFIRFRVKESDVWSQSPRRGWQEQGREIRSHWRLFLYLLAFMTMMLFASHGTQDMYPTFLQRQWHFSSARRSAITAISGCAAIIGGVIVGHLSDKWGRRRAMIAAFVLAIVVIPMWAFAASQPVLIAGAIFMQFMVQGAWGVVPAHLAELSPTTVRAFLPGFAYQCAGVLASSVVFIEAAYARHGSYSSAMALTALSVFILAAIIAAAGGEGRGRTFA